MFWVKVNKFSPWFSTAQRSVWSCTNSLRFSHFSLHLSKHLVLFFLILQVSKLVFRALLYWVRLSTGYIWLLTSFSRGKICFWLSNLGLHLSKYFFLFLLVLKVGNSIFCPLSLWVRRVKFPSWLSFVLRISLSRTFSLCLGDFSLHLSHYLILFLLVLQVSKLILCSCFLRVVTLEFSPRLPSRTLRLVRGYNIWVLLSSLGSRKLLNHFFFLFLLHKASHLFDRINLARLTLRHVRVLRLVLLKGASDCYLCFHLL